MDIGSLPILVNRHKSFIFCMGRGVWLIRPVDYGNPLLAGTLCYDQLTIFLRPSG